MSVGAEYSVNLLPLQYIEVRNTCPYVPSRVGVLHNRIIPHSISTQALCGSQAYISAYTVYLYFPYTIVSTIDIARRRRIISRYSYLECNSTGDVTQWDETN